MMYRSFALLLLLGGMLSQLSYSQKSGAMCPHTATEAGLNTFVANAEQEMVLRKHLDSPLRILQLCRRCPTRRFRRCRARPG